MASKPQQLNEIQKKNLEAAMGLAQLSIENSQRIVELQVETAKALFEDGVKSAKALSESKDPKQLMDLRAQYAQAATERMMGCATRIAQITTETQTEFGRMVSQQLTSGSKEMADAVQKMLSGMPVNGMQASESIQSAMDNARQAFEQFTKASQDALGLFGKPIKRL